jgi:rRNA maturation RNase YbeY
LRRFNIYFVLINFYWVLIDPIYNTNTDIISFDLSETKGKLIGEVYISIDRVKDNAQTHKTSLKEELLRVIFHGALHFCGYKDKKPADIKKMRAQEDKWLKSYLKSVS